MRAIFSRVVLIAWALFFGANIAVFLFMTALFRVNRQVAIDAGGVIFPTYERYAIIVGIFLLIGIVALRLITKRASATAAFVLVGLACITLVVSSMIITPKINDHRIAGTTSSAEFKKAHGQSMGLYSAQAVCLLLAGLILPAAIRDEKTPARDTGVSPVMDAQKSE